MQEKTFKDRFERETAVVLGSLGTSESERDAIVRDSYDDLTETLGLSRPCIALLAWALGNMNGTTLDTDCVSSLIGYPEKEVSLSLDELERRRYMVGVGSDDIALDVTEETKERIIDHYCYGKLIYC